jgi:hypothetical protein
MIGRIWHGWTTPQNAEKYEGLLNEETFSGIAEKNVPGYKGIQVFRRPLDGEEVEFVTIMWFDTWDASGSSPGRIVSERMCFRQRVTCWRGSTSIPNTTRSRKVLNTRELTQLGAFPKRVSFGPRHGSPRNPYLRSSENSVHAKFAEFYLPRTQLPI